jgi:hypothetical protein
MSNDGSDLPVAGRRPLTHEIQSFAGTPAATVSIVTPPAPIYPPIPLGRSSIALTAPFFAGPIVGPPVSAQPAAIFPHSLPVPPSIFHILPFLSSPSANTLANLSFPGHGPAGAATFILSLEPGTKVTLAWGTEVIKSYSGREQRINTTGPRPRQRFEGNAFLLDGPGRDLRSRLQRSAPSGSTFLLALPYEELNVTADSIAQTLTVLTTTQSDWAIVTQRVIVVNVDDVATPAVIQAVTATTIRLDITPSVRAGARIMPLISVLLDPQQGFSRYAVNVELWSIRAMANAFGWVGQDVCGVGVQILTYASGLVNASSLTDADLLIFDRPNTLQGTSADAMLSGADLVDLGGLPFAAGSAPVPDWGRPIRYSSPDAADWQWLKAFLRQLRGRQRAFLLPTNHADLVYVSTPTSMTLKVSSGSVTGAGDYTAWYASSAHRTLALTKADGSIQYVAVTTTPNDNHDGTLTLALDSVVSGSIARISFAELVRIDNSDSDNIPVTWDGGMFTIELLARTTGEAIAVHGKPATAAQMTTACRIGTWMAGWLCEDAASPLVGAFGGTNLPETTVGGSPAYRVAGPLGDKAVHVTVENTGWSAASTAFLDPTATMDICGVIVARIALPLSETTTLVSKTDFAGGPGFELFMSSTAITFNVDHTSPGNVAASATVPDTLLSSNEWFVAMFALDRSAGTMRVAIRSLASGSTSIGASQSIGVLGSVSNAGAPFRVSRGGGLGNTLEIDAVYMSVDVGVAAGLPAGLASALSNFVTYLGA